MAYEFFVLMQRRSDGKQFADLHKTTEEMFLLEEDADLALDAMGSMGAHFDKVKMVALLDSEWRTMEPLTANEHQIVTCMREHPDPKLDAAVVGALAGLLEETRPFVHAWIRQAKEVRMTLPPSHQEQTTEAIEQAQRLLDKLGSLLTNGEAHD